MTRAACGFALALASLAAAPAPVVEVRNAGDPAKRVEARAELDAGEIRLSGEVRLTLTVEGPAPLSVTPARPLLTKSNVWRVREDGLPIREVLANDREKWSQVYRLSPLVPGEPKIALGPLTVRPGGEQDLTIEWKSEPAVRVTTSIESPTPDALRPATDIEHLPPPPPVERGSSRWLFAIVPALLVLAAAGLFLGKRKQPAAAPRDAPWALHELTAGNLTADHCATVLRQYLAYRFGVQAETRTTPELAAGLRADGRLPDGTVAEWQARLDECDAARFSGTAVTVVGLADRARALVEAAEQTVVGEPGNLALRGRRGRPILPHLWSRPRTGPDAGRTPMAITPQQRAPARPAPRLRPAGPRVSVVVINFCQWRNTDRLTRQLLDADAIDAGTADVIVVDNDSPADPALGRLRRTPGVSLKRFDRNTGFAKAANAGCRLGRGDWVLLLNPDTAVPEGFLDQLEALCRTLEDEEPRAGVVGLSLRHADGTDQASSGPPPTLGRTLAGLVLPRRVRKCRPVRASDRAAVPWVTGCGMLIRRDCWADLGGFDESFFLYYEDADFCRRAWAAGWSVWYEPGLRLTHFSPLHTRPVPPELRLMTRHALLTYAAKYWGGWRTRALAGVVGVEALARQARAWAAGRPAGLHAELRRLAGDWLAGRPLAARWRVRRVARHLEGCAGREDAIRPAEPAPLRVAG